MAFEGDNLGLYTEGSTEQQLFRRAWESYIIQQGNYPSADNLIRLSAIKKMQPSSQKFVNGMGHPICILPGMSAENGTKLTIAIDDIRIAAANYDESARRDPLGTTIVYGHGSIEIFYVDDAGITPGSGNIQHDNLSRVKSAETQMGAWHYSHVDECLRIPIIGRRGIGNNFYAFPYPEKGKGDTAVQPKEVNAFWRDSNRLQAPSHNYFGKGKDDEASLTAADTFTARKVKDMGDALFTMSSARQEFPVRDLKLAQGVSNDMGGAGGGKANRIMLISTEMANALSRDNSEDYSYMKFHLALAGSSNPYTSMFWSNMIGNIGDTALVKEHKWTAHRTANNVLVQRAVVLGADSILMAYGTAPWQQISGVPKHVMVTHSEQLGALGRTWRMVGSPINQGQSQKSYSSTYMGTKVNRIVHPTTKMEQDWSRAVLTVAVDSVRPDGQI